MAGGWTRDGAVSEQIEASISDELERMRARRAPVGESLTECAECGEASARRCTGISVLAPAAGSAGSIRA